MTDLWSIACSNVSNSVSTPSVIELCERDAPLLHGHAFEALQQLGLLAGRHQLAVERVQLSLDGLDAVEHLTHLTAR